MMNLNMMNMMNNMNNGMIHNQNNNNQNNNELILNLINQNIQLQNQIQVNNNMIKSILENSNNNLGNINQKSNLFDEIADIDFFPGNEGRKINIIFDDGNFKLNIVTPVDATMRELFNIFHIKLQIYGKATNRKIYKLNEYFYLYKGSIVSNFEKTISENGMVNEIEHIIFKLKNDLIGG